MRKVMMAMLCVLCLAGCSKPEKTEEVVMEEEQKMTKIVMQIGEYTFTATPEDNQATYELLEWLKEEPRTIQMDDFAGFEKVGYLGRSFSAEDVQTTTYPGDIVLYSSDNVVVFYGSNSWAYTRLGHVDDMTDWEEALGNGSVNITFSVE